MSLQTALDDAIAQVTALRQFRRGSFTEVNLVMIALLLLSQSDGEGGSSLDPVTGTRQQQILEALTTPTLLLAPEAALTASPSHTPGRDCFAYTHTLAQIVVSDLINPVVVNLQGTLWDNGSHYGNLAEGLLIEENGVYFMNIDAPLTRIRGSLLSGSASVVFRFAFSRYN